MTFETIKYSLSDGVAELRLNRPQMLNSFNVQMHQEIRTVIDQVENDKSIRCLLLTANGRGFCAGQDLNDRAVAPGGEAPDLGASVEAYYNPLVRSLTGMPKPVVCAVNGVAAGAGANIALACDIVLAARSASFIESFCKIGVIPDSGGTWNLPRLVGLARARGLALTGEKISAEKAESWGMIWRCVDDEALMTEARALAKHLATQPTKGLGLIKQALLGSANKSLHEQLEVEKELMRTAGRTHDYQEGVAAFTQKRQPNFKGE
ncbi:MAG: 2-(1,2-epoxy-1,2-dihydrophenyl)acetyl-CoA isomerase [Pseudomonadales bacterium]|nr:2-(1,2-epoxy-1,2-dihydrophenyl)acetyl-CoA isomerase [Pseudomonadales bacterium]MCP5214928.1 2-(1,2-epoxy-1,2-dihydrophenyl)acetyl-CoA isomerase [Pseudomonadales bacterium]